MPDYTSPVEIDEARRIERPIDRDPNHFLVRRRYLVKEANRNPLSISTGLVDATFPGNYLIRDREIRAHGDILEFERVFANVPATRDEPVAMAYTFPGWLDQRDPVTLTVRARVHHEYFYNADPTHASTGIALIAAQRYVLDAYPDADVSYLNDSSTDPTRTEYKALVAAGTEIVAQDSSIEQYMGNIWLRRTPYIAAR